MKQQHSIVCPVCRTRFTTPAPTYSSSNTEYNATARYIGSDAESLRQVHPPHTRQLPNLPNEIKASKTGQRLMQTCISCGTVAAFLAFPNVITATGMAVWFGSLLLGRDNWDVLLHLLDRNKDGRVDLRDVKDMLDWWKDGDDEQETPPPPSIPVQVIKGSETTFGAITGVTQEQLAEAARVMFSVVHTGKAFARSRVGHIFGSNEEFSRVQKEMITLKLLEGNDNAGYKLTNEGLTFLSRYHPSPTPD